LARTLSRSHKIPTLCLCDYGSVAVRFDPSATTAASFLCQDTNSLLGRLETRAGTGGGQAPPHIPKFIRSTNPNSLSLRFVTGMNAHHHHPTLKPPALSTETPPPNTKTGVDQHKRTRAGTNKTLVSGERVGLLSFGGGCALGGSVSNMYGVWFLLWTAGRVCVRFVWLCCEVLLCLVMVVFVR